MTMSSPTSTRSRSIFHLAIALLITFAALATTANAAAGDACSSSAKCDSSAPCCSATGTCGSGALFCTGCQPLSSYKPSSCLANPICQNTNITFKPENYNDPSIFRPILQYNGDASLAPFTLDSGSLGKGPQGVLGQLTIDRQIKLSTTRYVLYGDVEARIRSNVTNGLVVAFILMSDTHDEIDWEFTTADVSSGKTNIFWQGLTATASGQDIEQKSMDRTQWNTFGINWQQNSIQWKVNGQVVRTLRKSEAGNNGANYPRSPSRVQLAVWAGGNSTNPQGVIDWSGGPIDWNTPYYQSTGYYQMELGSFSVNCADPNSQGLTTTGTGNNITSWVYTGANDSSTGNEPGFQLNKNPLTFLKNAAADGHYGLPGYEDQTAATKGNSNMWDGSGDTGANDAAAGGSSGSGSGGGVTAASAKKYGIPIAAGVVGLILLWALIVWCVRKRRRDNNGSGSSSGGGVTGGKGGAATGVGVVGTAASNLARRASKGFVSSGHVSGGGGGISSGHGAKYTQLHDAGAGPTASDYDLPMGAEKQGYGIGPASGPRPQRQQQQQQQQRQQDSYPMSASAWNRVQTPNPQQHHNTAAAAGWGTGSGYGHSQQSNSSHHHYSDRGGSDYYHSPRQQQQYSNSYAAPQQPYSAGGMGYYQQQQPHQQQQQQGGYYASQQGQGYGTPRYYS